MTIIDWLFCSIVGLGLIALSIAVGGLFLIILRLERTMEQLLDDRDKQCG